MFNVQIEFSPPLSQRKQKAIEGLAVGLLDKLALGFDVPFWNDKEQLVMTIAEERIFFTLFR
jgi:monoamine oxidase